MKTYLLSLLDYAAANWKLLAGLIKSTEFPK